MPTLATLDPLRIGTRIVTLILRHRTQRTVAIVPIGPGEDLNQERRDSDTNPGSNAQLRRRHRKHTDYQAHGQGDKHSAAKSKSPTSGRSPHREFPDYPHS